MHAGRYAASRRSGKRCSQLCRTFCGKKGSRDITRRPHIFSAIKTDRVAELAARQYRGTPAVIKEFLTFRAYGPGFRSCVPGESASAMLGGARLE